MSLRQEEDQFVNVQVLAPFLCQVNHIAFSVQNADRSYAFYNSILGAKLLNRPKFANNGYWLWLGNVQLHLIENPMKTIVDDFDQSGANINHLSFETNNLTECKEKLREAGVPFEEIITPTDVAHIQQVR